MHRKEASVVTSCLSSSSSSGHLFLGALHLNLLFEAIIIILFLFISLSPNSLAPNSQSHHGNCQMVIGLAWALDRSWGLLAQSHHWPTYADTSRKHTTFFFFYSIRLERWTIKFFNQIIAVLTLPSLPCPLNLIALLSSLGIIVVVILAHCQF